MKGETLGLILCLVLGLILYITLLVVAKPPPPVTVDKFDYAEDCIEVSVGNEIISKGVYCLIDSIIIERSN